VLTIAVIRRIERGSGNGDLGSNVDPAASRRERPMHVEPCGQAFGHFGGQRICGALAPP
jgi:hypothetical protein